MYYLFVLFFKSLRANSQFFSWSQYGSVLYKLIQASILCVLLVRRVLHGALVEADPEAAIGLVSPEKKILGDSSR